MSVAHKCGHLRHATDGALNLCSCVRTTPGWLHLLCYEKWFGEQSCGEFTRNWTWSTSCNSLWGLAHKLAIKLVKFRMYHHTVRNWPEIVYCPKHSMVEWQIYYVKHRYTYVNTSNLYSFLEVLYVELEFKISGSSFISWNFRKNFRSNVFIMIICDSIGFWWKPALTVINLQHITDQETQQSTNWIALATNQACATVAISQATIQIPSTQNAFNFCYFRYLG